MEIRCFRSLREIEYSRFTRDSIRHGMACSFIFASTIRVTSARNASWDLPLALDNVLQLLIALGIEVAEREILEFSADFAHAEPVCKRRVDVQCFPRNCFTTFAGQVLEGPHVVQAIGKLHHDDANIIGHREKHLAEVFCLLFFLGGEVDLADLRNAVDDVSDVRHRRSVPHPRETRACLRQRRAAGRR